MANTLTEQQIETMAIEIRNFLLAHRLWIDVAIYFNGKAFSTSDGNRRFTYNDPDDLIVLEDQDPTRITGYAGDILTMTFEGPLYDCMNFTGELGHDYESKIESWLSNIFLKYGCYYELCEAWSLTLCKI